MSVNVGTLTVHLKAATAAFTPAMRTATLQFHATAKASQDFVGKQTQVATAAQQVAARIKALQGRQAELQAAMSSAAGASKLSATALAAVRQEALRVDRALKGMTGELAREQAAQKAAAAAAKQHAAALHLQQRAAAKATAASAKESAAATAAAAKQQAALATQVRGSVGALGMLHPALTGTTGAIGAVAFAGYKAVSMFADFEKGMTRVGAVTNTIGTSAFGDLKRAALESAKTTEFTARQTADAMGFLGQAGFSANQVIAATPAVLQLASAAMLDVATSADIVSNVMSGYGISTEGLANANNVLVATMTSANTDLQQLGQAFKYVGPVAKGLGIDFTELSATLGVLGNAGIQSTMAGTALRGALTRLINPSKQEAEILERLNVSVKDSSGKMRSLTDIVWQLERAGASTADVMALFGDRAGPAMQVLVDQGAHAISNLQTKIEGAGEIAERIADAQLNTLSGQMKILASNVEALAISFGEVLASSTSGAVSDLVKMAEAIGWVIDQARALEKLTNGGLSDGLRNVFSGLTFGLVDNSGVAQLKRTIREQEKIRTEAAKAAGKKTAQDATRLTFNIADDVGFAAAGNSWSMLAEVADRVTKAKKEAAKAAEEHARALANEQAALAKLAEGLRQQVETAGAQAQGPIAAIALDFGRQYEAITRDAKALLERGGDVERTYTDLMAGMDSIRTLAEGELLKALRDMAREGSLTNEALVKARGALNDIGGSPSAAMAALGVAMAWQGSVGGVAAHEGAGDPQVRALIDAWRGSVGGVAAHQPGNKGEDAQVAAIDAAALRAATRQAETESLIASQISGPDLGGLGSALGTMAGPMGSAIGGVVGGVIQESIGKALGAVTDALKALAGDKFSELFGVMAAAILPAAVLVVLAVSQLTIPVIAAGLAFSVLLGPLGAVAGGLLFFGFTVLPAVAVAAAVLGAGLLHLVSKTETFAKVQDAMGVLFDATVAAMEPFAEALLLNTGIAEGMFEALKFLSVVLLNVAIRLAPLFDATAEQTVAMIDALQGITNMSFDAAMAKAEEAKETRETSRAMREFREEMRSVPEIFKYIATKSAVDRAVTPGHRGNSPRRRNRWGSPATAT